MGEYHFSAELAKRYGLDEAIMLHHFAYWVQKNTIDGRNIHDGRAWSYSTQAGRVVSFLEPTSDSAHLEEPGGAISGHKRPV